MAQSKITLTELRIEADRVFGADCATIHEFEMRGQRPLLQRAFAAFSSAVRFRFSAQSNGRVEDSSTCCSRIERMSTTAGGFRGTSEHEKIQSRLDAR